MMQRILKGDTSGQIALALADGYNYAGCVVEFRYQGAVRTFRNCEAGQTIQFNFTAAETAVMALGAFPVTVRLFTPDGRFFTVNNADVKIEVTDCVADVREGGVIVVEATSGLYGVDDLPERYTTKDIREKINEIIQRLGGGVAALCLAACVACGSLFGAGVTVQKANLEDIHNDEKVVTGVTFDASGLATADALDGKRGKHDLTVYGHGWDFSSITNVVPLHSGDSYGIYYRYVPREPQPSLYVIDVRRVDKWGNHLDLGSSGEFNTEADARACVDFTIVRSTLYPAIVGKRIWFESDDRLAKVSETVPVTRKINGQPLTGDIYIEGMSGNALCWDNDAVKTHDGSKIITAGDIGAISTSTGGIVRLSNSDAGAGFKKTSTGYTSFYVGYNAFGTVDNGAHFQWTNGGYADWFSGSVLRMLTGSQMWLLSGTKPWLQTDTDFHIGGNAYGGGTTLPAYVDGRITSKGYQTSTQVQTAIANAGHATAEDLAPISTKVDQSLIYSSGVYQYMTGNTNAWFSGTNYVVTADGTTRTKFAWEDGMDAGTVPCSMSLWEIRDGKKVVWDQRDWTVWYWNFKSGQLRSDMVSEINRHSDFARTNYMSRGWAKYTAVCGLDNPDPSTLWIDTPKVQLMAGHQWEKIVEVGGAGYWTITGNGIELAPQDADSTYLSVKDFEGNACLTFRKTASYLVYCEGGTDITGNYKDAQGRVVFHLATDMQPTAEFSTILDVSSFVPEGDDGCPANCVWTGSAGAWDCHFLLKDGISSRVCYARFKVLREGENAVECTVPLKLNGGIVIEQDGVSRKIRPTITGSTVNWVVVP